MTNPWTGGGFLVTRWTHQRVVTPSGVCDLYDNLDFGRTQRPRPHWVALGDESLTNLARCARFEFEGNWLQDDPCQPFTARVHYDREEMQVEEFRGLQARRLYAILREWYITTEEPRD